MREKWFVKSLKAEHGWKSKCIEDFSTRGLVIVQTEVSKVKSIAVANATKTGSLGNMDSIITTPSSLGCLPRVYCSIVCCLA